MGSIELDFDDVAALDRKAVLIDAARRVDALHGHMAPGEVAPETQDGKILRTLAEDEGRFAKSPVVRKITDQEYLGRGLPVPVDVAALFGKYRHYLLEIPFELDPAAGWAFNKLEVRIDFNPDDKTPREQPKVYQIFPDPKFQSLFEANANLEVGVKANGEFDAKTGSVAVQAGQASFKMGADLGAEAGAKAGLVLGPFRYSVKKALINHRGTGKEWARWEISGTQLNKGDDPRLMVIVQVPKDLEAVKVRGQLLASRYFSLGNYSLVEAVKNLPDTLQRFFEGGTPYHRANDWDVTGQMELCKAGEHA